MIKKIFILAVFILSALTTINAEEIPLEGFDLPTVPKRPRAPKIIQVTADLSTTDLYLNFSGSVGVAVVTVKDSNGSIVQMESLNTDTENELYISIENMDSDDYILTIEYQNKILIGYFSI